MGEQGRSEEEKIRGTTLKPMTRGGDGGRINFDKFGYYSRKYEGSKNERGGNEWCPYRYSVKR